MTFFIVFLVFVSDKPLAGGSFFSLLLVYHNQKHISMQKEKSLGDELPQSRLRRDSPLWDGAFGMAVQFPAQAQSFWSRQRLPPRGSWQNRQVLTEGVNFPSPAMIHPAQPYAVRERCRNSVRRQKGGKQADCRFWGGKVVRFADFDTTFAKDSPPRY